MKNLLIMIIMIISSVSSFARAQMFGTKSGYIEFKLNGSEKGTKKMWFDNYGEYIRIETNTVATIDIGFGPSFEKKSEIQVTNSDGLFIADMINMTGMKMKSFFEVERPEEVLNNSEMDNLGIEMLKKMGGKIIGKEKILGKETQIVELMGIKSWYYENLSLKMQGEILGQKIEEIATKFDENVKIDKKLFKAPDGIDYVDRNEIMQVLNYEEEKVKMDYSIEEFKKSIETIKIEGYNKMYVQDTGDEYVSFYMKGEEEIIQITVAPLDDDFLETEQIAIDNGIEKTKLNGKDVYIGHDSKDGIEVSYMLVPDFKRKITRSIVIIGSSYNKNDFEKIYSQIKLK